MPLDGSSEDRPGKASEGRPKALSESRRGSDDDPPSTARALRILLVDDDRVDRMAVRRLLDDAPIAFEIEEVTRAAAAVSALARGGFDGVLLDFRLPDGDALETVHHLADAGFPVPPVIVLTRQGSESIAVELLKSGVADYLPKNELSTHSLSQSIRGAVRLRRVEEALSKAHNDLERRVVERTLELEEANRQLELEIARRSEIEQRARRQLDELAHVDRVGTLGEMAAALAHEIHQPLGAIVNFARGCERQLASGQAKGEVLEAVMGRIIAQAERAVEIVRRQRAFASRRGFRREAVDPLALVRDVTELLKAEVEATGTELELELEADLPPIQVDGIQIQQVFVNLLRNSLEAMADTPAGNRRLEISCRRAGNGRTEIAIADRGCGWPVDDLDRLFESFFTTKEGGMGLGLSISRSIVEAHGGQLEARPNAEGGLVLRFDLPSAIEDRSRDEGP